ncbi:acyl-homoserine-lactone synthase [Sediminicurvatus halobius]|uniref:acyl-homoserine-lactone synthase n=1 Tax=Sediminicurvatus halobius TaxID=2182432 RepID=UPI001304CB49|nr:GNAT family N-acyltransferase [Spiribacter halobius]UEX77367.1 GNAT family N-acetyltransferase [Spiribacter halobius]
MAQAESAPDHPRGGFSGYLADTRESRQIHYRIRYQVYCERKGFEDNAVLRKRGLERDAYDGHALPFIFRDEHDERWRGTARLVIRGASRLPIEEMGALPGDFCSQHAPGSVAELSRVAALTPPTSHGHGRWELLKTTLGSVLVCAQQFGIGELLFLITPSLARVVRGLGIPMRPVGHPVRHRGERRAFASCVPEALESLAELDVRPSLDFCSRLRDAPYSPQRLLA